MTASISSTKEDFMKRTTLTEALERIRNAPNEGVLVVGDLGEELLGQVLEACGPRVKAAVYNTTDPVVGAVAAYGAAIRVGDAAAGREPRLVVQTSDGVVRLDGVDLRRTDPIAVFLALGTSSTVLWFFSPDKPLWLAAAVCTLVGAILVQLDIRGLRRRFGTDSDRAQENRAAA